MLYREWGNRFDRGKCVNEFLLSKNADAQKLLAIFLLLFSAVCLEKHSDFGNGFSDVGMVCRPIENAITIRSQL